LDFRPQVVYLAADMSVRPVRPGDTEVWIEMRAALWPDASRSDHRRDAAAILEGEQPSSAFVAVSSSGEIVGFIEVSLRPYAEGCRSSPVGYVEGWFMRPGHRRQGLGREMLLAAEDWARRQGCTEMGSDTEVSNRLSRTVHQRLGYEVVETVVTFRKRL
jgi:aminoglycoside 6'-N-acetyltransferase I